MSDPQVRTTPAVLAPFAAFARELKGIFDVPLAALGGLFGMILSCAGLVAFFMYAPNLAVAQDDEEDLLEIEFEPGELVRLGPKPEDLPEKIIVEETIAEEQVVEEAVTKEEEPPPPKPEPPEKKDKPKKPAKEKPDPSIKKDAKKADKNQKSNTPHDDLPTVDELPGDPFGDVDGWSDLKKDGDPWATSVMAALNKMQYPSFGAQSKKGTYQFRLKVCKDGRVDKVYQKGSTGDPKLDKAMLAEIMKLKIPKPTAKIAKMMKTPCVTLKYNFKWTASGKVK